MTPERPGATPAEAQRPRRPQTLPWGRADWIALALIAAGTVAALWWYWGRTPHPYSDTTMAIYRAFEVDRSIARRLLYPRWAMDFNFAYGAPLLQYRAPLVHYLIPGFHWAGLGWINAARAVASLALFLSGAGMYVYARWLFADRRAALASATAYLFAPYILANIHERGALSEAAALAVLPWLAWAAHRALEEKGALWLWLTALLTALLVLAHNIVAFVAVPFLLGLLGVLAWRERGWRSLAAVIGAMTLGLGMSAVYWAPALFERDHAKIAENMLQDFGQWLASAGQVVQRSLTFDYWGLDRFRLALWQAVVALAAALLLAFGPRHRALLIGLLVLTVGAILVLQLDAAKSFWESAPLVRFVQFSWRLIGLAAFCVALTAGYLMTGTRLTGPAGWGAVAGLAAWIAVAGLAQLGPASYPHTEAITDADITLQELSERGRSYFTIFNDFMPVGVALSPPELLEPRPESDPRREPMGTVPEVVVREDRPNSLGLRVNASEPFTIRFHKFYYPGWQVVADGRDLPTRAEGALGLVTADLPAGAYEATIVFRQTPLRRVADVVTVASWLAWLVAGLLIRPARRVLAALGLVMFLFGALGAVRHGLGEPARRPVERRVNFEDTLHLLGHHIPAGEWHPGDAIPVTLYWLVQRSPEVDYTIFLHLAALDDSGKVAQDDSRPVNGYGATTRWEPGEVVVDEHSLRLGEDVPPGRYRLLAGVYDPATLQNLRTLGAPDVLPGERVVLAEVEVTAAAPR
jgi:hypothetical protein